MQARPLCSPRCSGTAGRGLLRGFGECPLGTGPHRRLQSRWALPGEGARFSLSPRPPQGSPSGIFPLHCLPGAEAMAPVGRRPGAVLAPCMAPGPGTDRVSLQQRWQHAPRPSRTAAAAAAVSRVSHFKPDTVRDGFLSLGSSAYAILLLLVYSLCI